MIVFGIRRNIYVLMWAMIVSFLNVIYVFMNLAILIILIPG